MKLAPLQLVKYWIESLKFDHYESYDSDEEPETDHYLLDIKAKTTLIRDAAESGKPSRWVVKLHIVQTVNRKEWINIPYEYSLDLFGLLDAHPDLKGDQLQKAVELNGPSMLFGPAREIIRSITSLGSHGPLLLPSVYFLPPAPNPQDPPKKKESVQAKPRPRKPKNS